MDVMQQSLGVASGRGAGLERQGLLDKVPGECMNRLIMNQAIPVDGRHEGHSDGSGVRPSPVGNCEGDTVWAASSR